MCATTEAVLKWLSGRWKLKLTDTIFRQVNQVKGRKNKIYFNKVTSVWNWSWKVKKNKKNKKMNFEN